MPAGVPGRPVKYRFTAGCQRSGGSASTCQCKRGPGRRPAEQASGVQSPDAGRIRRTRTRSDHEQKVPTRRDCPASRPRQRQLPGAAGRHGRPVAIDGLVYRLGDRGRAQRLKRQLAEARESAGEWETAARQRPPRLGHADEVVHEHAWKSAGVAALVGCCWDAAWPRAAGAERSRRDVRRRALPPKAPVGRGAGRDGRPPAGSGGRRLRLELGPARS